jgi:hypothetical protein
MNTCAFVTIASIFLVAYCDSQLYSNKIYIILDSSTFFSFISKIVKYGITASIYSQRADIIINTLRPNVKELDDLKLVVCDSMALKYLIH